MDSMGIHRGQGFRRGKAVSLGSPVQLWWVLIWTRTISEAALLSQLVLGWGDSTRAGQGQQGLPEHFVGFCSVSLCRLPSTVSSGALACMCVGSGRPRGMSQERIPGECHLLFYFPTSRNHEVSHVASLRLKGKKYRPQFQMEHVSSVWQEKHVRFAWSSLKIFPNLNSLF